MGKTSLFIFVWILILANSTWATLYSNSGSCQIQSTAMSLSSPTGCQVIQRNSDNTAPIKVSGQLQVTGSLLKIKVTDPSGNTVIASKDVNVGNLSSFQVILDNVAAGGWYKLSVTQLNAAGNVVASAVVEKIGVGEVFVTAGQSNSVGSGQLTGIAAPEFVSASHALTGEFAAAKEPMPFDTATGGSAWPHLGEFISKNFSVPVSFTVVGCGGTQISQWLPSPIHLNATIEANANACLHGQFSTLNARLKEAVAKQIHQGNGIRAILWHQGESDRGDTTANYYNRFKTIHDQLNVDLGKQIEWYVAQATFIPDENSIYAPIGTNWPSAEIQCSSTSTIYPPLMAPIQAAQQAIWKDGLAHQGPNTDILIGSYRWGTDAAHGGGYCIHFSASGVIAHANAWLTQLSPALSTSTVVAAPYSQNVWLIKTPAERAALRAGMSQAQINAQWESFTLDQKLALNETNTAYNEILAGHDPGPKNGAPYSVYAWIIKSPAERASLRAAMPQAQTLLMWDQLNLSQKNAMTLINQAYQALQNP